MKTFQEENKEEINSFVKDCVDTVKLTYKENGHMPLTGMGLLYKDGDYKSFILTDLDSDDNDPLLESTPEVIRKFNEKMKPIVFVLIAEAQMFIASKNKDTGEDLPKQIYKVLTLKFETHNEQMVVCFDINSGKINSKATFPFNYKWTKKNTAETDGKFNNLLSENNSFMASMLKESSPADLN